MKPHPRIRKTIKWGGAAVTVLLVVVWIASAWWRVRWSGYPIDRGLDAGVSSGAVFWVYRNPWADYDVFWPGWTVAPSAETFDWSAWFNQRDGRLNFVIPLWPVALAGGIAAGLAWRLDTLASRRGRPNLCPKCNYDRTGLPGGSGAVCPECGTACG